MLRYAPPRCAAASITLSDSDYPPSEHAVRAGLCRARLLRDAPNPKLRQTLNPKPCSMLCCAVVCPAALRPAVLGSAVLGHVLLRRAVLRAGALRHRCMMSKGAQPRAVVGSQILSPVSHRWGRRQPGWLQYWQHR